jgi:hypothetical protein
MAGGQSQAWSQPSGRSRLKQRRIESRSITELASGGWPSASPLTRCTTLLPTPSAVAVFWMRHPGTPHRQRPAPADQLLRGVKRRLSNADPHTSTQPDLAPMLVPRPVWNVGCRPAG